MSGKPEITQRDLHTRSEEIMDAVQDGQAFTATRDGHRIGEPAPLRRRRRFVPRGEFAAISRTAPRTGQSHGPAATSAHTVFPTG